MNYTCMKVFQPRTANQEVWDCVIRRWTGTCRYISWYVANEADGDILDIGSEWLIKNGAEPDEFVILDMG